MHLLLYRLVKYTKYRYNLKYCCNMAMALIVIEQAKLLDLMIAIFSTDFLQKITPYLSKCYLSIVLS